MTKWRLDGRLEAESHPMTSLGLCRLLLMNDSRWPWIVLVPQRPDVVELHDLTPLDLTMLTFELSMCAKALKGATGCLKVNIGAIGNQVRQLHLHVVARNEGDPGWPGPVWGHGERQAYEKSQADALGAAILERL